MSKIARENPSRTERSLAVAHNNVLSEAVTVAGSMVAMRGGKKIRALVWSVAVARAALTMLAMHQEAVKQASSSSVTLTSNDALYAAMQQWIAANIDQTSNNNFAATVNARRGIVYSQSGSGKLVIEHEGARITVESGEDGAKPSPFDDDDSPKSLGSYSQMLPQKMTLSSNSMSAIDSFLHQVLADLAVAAKTSRIYTSSRWGSWNDNSDVPPRSIESVVLADGLRDQIVADMSSFLRQEERYVQLGIPYHRGYLFWGAPGTGKTSIARALATHFNVDVYHIALSTIEDDGQLMELMVRIGSRSILLIEDIDVAGAEVAERDRDECGSSSTGKVTLSGLLNALDGLSTPHGLITIMTSNFPQRLDSALTRSGRVDRQFHIDYASPDQAAQIVKQFTGVNVSELPDRLVPSDIVEAIKGTFDMTDPGEIRRHIYSEIGDRAHADAR